MKKPTTKNDLINAYIYKKFYKRFKLNGYEYINNLRMKDTMVFIYATAFVDDNPRRPFIDRKIFEGEVLKYYVNKKRRG